MSSPSTPHSAEGPRAARGRPPRLDQGRTARAALDLLDEAGLDALTMRRLADAVGVRAGALYRHFATKQDLLTVMAERMLEGCSAPPPEGDWSERLTVLAHRMRTALLAHRDGARVYAGTHSTGANTLGFAEALVGVLREAGFRDEDAARAVLAVVNFTVGHTLEEQAALQPGDSAAAEAGPAEAGPAEAGPADPDRLRRAVAAQDFPHLTAALPVLTSTDFAAHFAFGLNLLVQGLRATERNGPAGAAEARP
ncbi:transcriptional regulator [Streptomyces sp. CB03578]|uniref:TetR/AcrR family transcriptional regulator n=1 Tax=Streptomyces sp. CB03578 TaxID=1718987 RepID=UPI000939B155|nr:TetR/AcrR family transcriptional regulator [Streptomyces sp. CB03578]OKI44537.1 transcriptional regulator [Streptomyces sp. CB03578]